MMIKPLLNLVILLTLPLSVSIAQACDDQRLVRGNNIILDSSSGLVWKDCAVSIDLECATSSDYKVSWEGASSAIRPDNSEGWRFPSVVEVASLIRSDCVPNQTVAGMLSNSVGINATFWTSTTAARARANAWAVDLDSGKMKSDAKATLAHGFLLVRDLRQGDIL